MDKLIAPKHDGSVYSIRYGASTMLLFGYSSHWGCGSATLMQSSISIKKTEHPIFINQIFSNLTSLSGYQDSNLGPPAPKAGALTGLRYTPNAVFLKKAMQRYNFFLYLQDLGAKKIRK